MNTKIYKQVHSLASQLLEAAQKEDEQCFEQRYLELTALCENNAGVERKDHPVQWETLADFTDDTESALALYRKALALAHDISSEDFIASINYSMALLLQQNKRLDEALACALLSKAATELIVDNELKREAFKLVKSLQAATKS
ncbi:hypothetical protein EDC56_2338 [Sinobacterium caligoides]|uniref:Replicative DNA helicase n=1 Tax=Sinobacterium caligoides TaxID=933926 RepID=A0A3N2DQK8_9GAMM|nr:tetratricopeptide repeat protein [Sinobacterium caligoides]ROS01889.1 hypothetical protein EDC56_2338 [Sinobacterium caligoides]